MRGLDVSALLGRQRGVEQQVGHAENAVERRADLVRDRGEEARLGAVGGFGLVARLRERLHLRFVQFPIVVGQALRRCASSAIMRSFATRRRYSMKASTVHATANRKPAPIA